MSYFIPDLVVYCSGGELTNEDNLLHNPVALFEVLSSSTEGYDHGPKWMKYQHIESLQHDVMISQNEPKVEAYTWEAEGDWPHKVVNGLDGSIHLSHLNLTLMLSGIY